MLLFNLIQLNTAEFFGALTVFLVLKLPTLGHGILGVLRDLDNYRSNRPKQ